MDEVTSTNDKVIFAVSFLAILVTLSNYKDSLTQIHISIFSHFFSVFDLLMYMSLVLFCSVYFSAIDKLRYSNLKLSRLKFLEAAGFIADFFYLVSILLLPLLFLTFYSCSCIYSYVFYPLLTAFNFRSLFYMNMSGFLSLIIGIFSLISSIIALFYTKKARSEESKIAIKDSYDIESNLLMQANEAYKGGNYDAMLVILNSIIENKIYAKLSEKRNLKRNLLSPNSIIEIAVNDGILTINQIKLIKEIRLLRNKAAHELLETPLDRD